MTRQAPFMAGIAGLLLILAGCDRQPDDTAAPIENAHTLTVFAAASLTEAVQEAANDFANRRSVKFLYNFAGSGTLAQQLIAAPRADVFISASEDWMDAVEERGRLLQGSRQNVLSNSLVIIGNRDATFEVREPSDLESLPFSFLALGNPDSVPAGNYAKQWLSNIASQSGADLWQRLSPRLSPAPDTRAALAQVAGQKDVIGIVYRTDYAARKSGVRLLYALGPDEGPSIVYPAAALATSPEPQLALNFLEYLRSATAQEIFAKHGFRSTSEP